MMGIVTKNKKGFSMLEMLVCICILSAFTLLSTSNFTDLNLDHYYFINNYCLDQSRAMLDKESIDVGKGVYFNAMGHVNQARTIDFGKHQVIIHLGNGYATYK